MPALARGGTPAYLLVSQVSKKLGHLGFAALMLEIVILSSPSSIETALLYPRVFNFI